MSAEANIQFVDPPATVGGRGESPANKAIAETLKKNPGQWALVAEGVTNDGLAVRIRSGKAKSFAQGEWEATSRGTEEGAYDIYARYVGE